LISTHRYTAIGFTSGASTCVVAARPLVRVVRASVERQKRRAVRCFTTIFVPWPQDSFSTCQLASDCVRLCQMSWGLPFQRGEEDERRRRRPGEAVPCVFLQSCSPQSKIKQKRGLGGGAGRRRGGGAGGVVPTPTPGGAAHIVQPPCTKRLPCVYTCKTGGQCCRCCRCPVAMVTLTTLARGNVRAEGTTVHTVCVCVCVW